MNVQQQLAFELRRRSALLPQEVGELKALADKNIGGLGIHQSQIATVKMVLDELQARQDQIAAELTPALPADQFAEKRAEIEQTLTGTHSIMATFRYIFAQRNESPHYGLILDVADLVAAGCYLPCMKLANQWNNQPQQHYREPPLTYLNAMLSPAAITRRHTLSKVGLQLHAELEKQLPIAVISLPFHDTVAVWTFCSLYHEVGHLLDNDLGLRAQVSAAVAAALGQAGAGDERKALWQLWAGEMIADAFGVLLGGAAFGYALTGMLFRPSQEVKTIEADRHPNEYVRVRLVVELLRGTKIAPLAEAAEKIATAWHATYGSVAEVAAYLDECKVVAGVLLGQNLAALNDHCLLDLAPTLANDHRRADALATWLLDEVERPEPESYPFRLVPAAAQLAVGRAGDRFDERYEAIQRRALAFLALIKRPKFLGPADLSAQRQAYLQGLAKSLSFATLDT